MRIAVCTRHIGSNAGTGADRVVVHGYRALTTCDRDNTYIGYHERIGRWGSASPFRTDLSAIVSDLILKNSAVPVWARKVGVDAFLHLAPPCCFAEWAIPQITYIFDVPKGEDNRHLKNRFFNFLVVQLSARKADHVLALSDGVKTELCSFYDLPQQRVTVVHPCIDLTVLRPLAGEAVLEAFLKRRGLSPGNYLLGVISRLWHRKTPGAYIEVYARLPPKLRAAIKLVLVGPASFDDLRPFTSETALAAVRDDVVFLGRVDSADLPYLYGGARVFLFLSKYEGFGLPVVEAMACGASVVASDIPAIREAAGGAALLVAGEDFDAVAVQCRQLLESQTERERWRAFGLARAVEFGYEGFAARMAATLRRVMGGGVL